MQRIPTCLHVTRTLACCLAGRASEQLDARPACLVRRGSARTFSPFATGPSRTGPPLTKTAPCAGYHQGSILDFTNPAAIGFSVLYTRLEEAARIGSVFPREPGSASRTLRFLASSPPRWRTVRSATAHPPMAHRQAPTPSWRSRLFPILVSRMKVCFNGAGIGWLDAL